MITKYVLLIGLFHRVYSNFFSFGIMRNNFVPYESTSRKIDVMQTRGSSIGDLFGVTNGVRLTSKLQLPGYARLLKSQPRSIQLIKSQVSNPQWSYSLLSNPQMNNPQQINLLQRIQQPNDKWNNGTVDNKIVKTEPSDNNNNNIVNDHKVSQQQENLKQTLKLEAAERLKQQQAKERLQQQTVNRLRQQAVEKLKQQAINELEQKKTHLFNLLEGVTKNRQENQKRNLEVWQRTVKQRNKRIQRRFYEHALHDNDDYDDDDDDND